MRIVSHFFTLLAMVSFLGAIAAPIHPDKAKGKKPAATIMDECP
jgi:hypothetical protein